jgi:hypothetical protein
MNSNKKSRCKSKKGKGNVKKRTAVASESKAINVRSCPKKKKIVKKASQMRDTRSANLQDYPLPKEIPRIDVPSTSR